jgi:hypothetical protein
MATFTVTATTTQGGTPNPGMALRVMVLTGASAVQNGATAASTVAAQQLSITPNATGSRVYGAGTFGSTSAFTPNASTTVLSDFSDSTNNGDYTSFKSTATTTASTPVTIGSTNTPATGSTALAEILGTTTEDGSGPPNATTTGPGLGVTTASFTPPPGSLLVALVGTNGGSSFVNCAITDSSGLGLTWTPLAEAHPSGLDYAGVWIARMPGGAAPLPFSPGQTWKRRFRHPQRLPLTPPAALAAPVIVPVVLRSRPASVQHQPRNVIQAAIQPPPVSVPVLRSRPARLLPARRGTVSGPLAPGAVAIITPVRPIVLTTPRRGPPPAPRRRLLTGMMPGTGLSGLPPTAFLRSRPAQVQHQSLMRLRAGQLPAPVQQARLQRHPVRLQRQPRMQVATGYPGALTVPLPQSRVLRHPARLARRQPGSLRTGMLPGTGLSGIPPSGPVRSLPARPRVRPPASRAVPPPFVPAGVVYPVMAYPARLRAVVYRLVRRPPGYLRTGMLPGTGVAAVPLGAFVLRGRTAPVPRVRARVILPVLSSPVPPPRPLAMAPRLARRRPGQLVTGIVIPPPLGAAVLRHARPRVVPVRPRLTAGITVVPVYPVVIQQAGPHRREPSRLARRQPGYLRTGMLPGAPRGFTGNKPWHAGGLLPRWAAKPAGQRWQARAASRWVLAQLAGRWRAGPASSRWRIIMTAFPPIAAISVEEVNVSWTSMLAGTSIDPTGQTAGQSLLPVQFAFPVSSGNVLAPAEPVTWLAGTWLTGQTTPYYVAQCLVGPSPGLIQLTAGQVYDVWSKITGTPEIPAKFAGQLSVY